MGWGKIRCFGPDVCKTSARSAICGAIEHLSPTADYPMSRTSRILSALAILFLSYAFSAVAQEARIRLRPLKCITLFRGEPSCTTLTL